MDLAFPALGFDDMHTFLVEPANWKNGSNPEFATQSNIDTVHGALEDFATTDGNSLFIPTDDFTQFEDNLIHFSKADQLTLGSRIASSIEQIIIPEPNAFLLTGIALLLAGGFVRVRIR